MHSRHMHRFTISGPTAMIGLAFLFAGSGLMVPPIHAIDGPGWFGVADPEDEVVDPPDAPAFREFRRQRADATPPSIPHSPAGDLLEAWIHAHNQKSADALRHWLRTSVNPSVSDAEVEKRLDWYVDAIDMFGPLSQEPLAVLEDEPHRLLVHLVRTDMGPRERFDPLNIVVVELDVDEEDPRYLARGLGLGSLACEAPKSPEHGPERAPGDGRDSLDTQWDR